jgi:hypothetical protein
LIVTLSKILAARQKLATQPRLPRLREPRRTLMVLMVQMVTLVTSIIVTMMKKPELLRRSKRFTKKKINKLRRI